jgi:hypothetical protein
VVFPRDPRHALKLNCKVRLKLLRKDDWTSLRITLMLKWTNEKVPSLFANHFNYAPKP